MIDDENNERNDRLTELKNVLKKYQHYLEECDDILSDDMMLVSRVINTLIL